MHELRNMPHGEQYTAALLKLLSQVAKSNPRGAVSLAVELATTPDEQIVYSQLFDEIARRDRAVALDALTLVPAREGRENALRALAVVWAGQDVVGALNWALGLADTADRAAAVEATLIIRAQRDPQRTLNLAPQFLTGDARDHVVTEAVRLLIAQDPNAAGQEILKLPDNPVKMRAILEVARAFAAVQPELALDWIKNLPAGSLQQTAVNNVLDFWAASNPDGASRFVVQLPAGASQESAASHLASDLARADPARALRFTDELPMSARTAAYIGLASGWARKDPAAATRWAASLPVSNSARATALKDALSYWTLADPAAAGAFATSLPAVPASSDSPR
ncbi:MAG: hypothetical protein ACR2HH_14435 [Chthoniobacterales bacterium]